MCPCDGGGAALCLQVVYICGPLNVARALTPRQVAQHEWVTNASRLPPLKLWSDGGAAAAGATGDAAAGCARGGAAAAEQAGALTAWVHQVKVAVPSVEERVFKKGHLLIRQAPGRHLLACRKCRCSVCERASTCAAAFGLQHANKSSQTISGACREGDVPAGLFLILSGTCEVIRGSGAAPAQQPPPAFAAAPAALPSPPLLRPPSAAGSGSFAAAQDFAEHLSDSEDDEDDEEGEDEEVEEEAEGAGAGSGARSGSYAGPSGNTFAAAAAAALAADSVALNLDPGPHGHVHEGDGACRSPKARGVAQPTLGLLGFGGAHGGSSSGGRLGFGSGSGHGHGGGGGACESGRGSAGLSCGGSSRGWGAAEALEPAAGAPADGAPPRLSMRRVSKMLSRISAAAAGLVLPHSAGPSPRGASPPPAALVGGGGVLGARVASGSSAGNSGCPRRRATSVELELPQFSAGVRPAGVTHGFC